MAEKTYIVPTDAEPTFWNKDALLWTFLLPIPIVGTMVGGLIGKSRMEREKEHGKPLDPPSFWNKSALIGVNLGFIAGAVGAFPVLIAATLLNPIIGIVAGLATVAAGTIGGLYIGGSSGKANAEEEYKAAEVLVEKRNALERATGVERSHTPPPQAVEALPSIINGGTYLGAILGSLTGSIVRLLLRVGLSGEAPMAADIAIGTTGQIGGTLIGGSIGKSGQRERYATAEYVSREEAEAIKRSEQITPQRAYTVTPEEAQLLESRLAQGKSHVDRTQGLQNTPMVSA